MESEGKKLFSKIKEKFKNISNFKIYSIACCLTGYMIYKYGKNRFIYSEHHGHFNSPQNMLNRRVYYHHLSEIILRFGFGVVGISAVLFLFRLYLSGSNFTQDVHEKKDVIDTKAKQYENGNNKEFEFQDFERDLNPGKKFSLDEMRKNKKVVEDYYKDKK